MTPTVWPHRLFRPRSQEWGVQGGSQEGGRPQSGATPQRIVFGGGGLNVAKLSNIRLRTREQVAAWTAIELDLDNGAGQIVVPRCSRRSGPLPSGVKAQGVTHSDGTAFADGAPYAGKLVASTALAAADFRATSLRLRLIGGRPLIGGERFSFLHPNAGWRIYGVARVSSQAAVEVGGKVVGHDYEIAFRTPLRERVAEGERIEWDLPRCTMRLADPNGMSLSVDLERFADVSVAFVEDLTVFASDLGF